jgi:NADH-quinone oxidoreductase subunit I
MTVGVKKAARPRKMSFPEGVYLVEIAKALWLTMSHLLRNIVRQDRIWTIEYPEVRRVMPPRFRGTHRLMRREDGSPRCTACFCCPTACPAKCITIVAGESPDPRIEKFPVRFDIDMLRCVFCGLCVEACPLDAIRMDTGWFTPPDDAREKLVFTIENLLERRG